MSNDQTDNRQDRVETLIDENIKLAFDSLLQEDIPERFKIVIAMLEAQESSDKGQSQ